MLIDCCKFLMAFQWFRHLHTTVKLNHSKHGYISIGTVCNERHALKHRNKILLNNSRENDCGWRRSNPNTSRPNFSLISEFRMVHLNACGIGLVLSPSAHVGSGNHGDMVLIHRGKRHDAYAFILERLMPFSGVPWCAQLGRAALFKLPTPEVSNKIS